MKILFVSCLVLYAGLTLVAACFDCSVPKALRLAIGVAVLVLLAGMRWSNLVPLGLLGLIAAALVSGFVQFGRPHWQHVGVRLALTLLLLWLWHAYW